MATADLPRILPYQPLRMSVERYHQLTKLGAFTGHDQVELLDGVVTEKMSKNPPHTIATRRCDLALTNLALSGWHIRNQEPITLSTSEPEPDVAIVSGQLEEYAYRHPIANEVGLVIEVADTSLITDRFKAELYAESGIGVYWIVNLIQRVVEVYQLPSSPSGVQRYGPPQLVGPQSEIPLTIRGMSWGRVRVSDLLPPTAE